MRGLSPAPPDRARWWVHLPGHRRSMLLQPPRAGYQGGHGRMLLWLFKRWIYMALSLFGGRGVDPFEFGSVWDSLSVRDSSGASQQFARDAHAIANTQVDWRETPEAHIIKADLPGLKKDEVKVQVLEGKTLEISGERKKEEVQNGDTWHRVERSHGNFMRRFRLPENSNVDEVQAQVLDGVLTVTIPKVQKPKPQVRQIEIA